MYAQEVQDEVGYSIVYIKRPYKRNEKPTKSWYIIVVLAINVCASYTVG